MARIERWSIFSVLLFCVAVVGCEKRHVVTLDISTLESGSCLELEQRTASGPPSATECLVVELLDEDGRYRGLREPTGADDVKFERMILLKGKSQLPIDPPAAGEKGTFVVRAYDGTGQVIAEGRSQGALCAGCGIPVALSAPSQFSCVRGQLGGDGPRQIEPESRALHSATLLDNGHVLIVGGITVRSDDSVIDRTDVSSAVLAQEIVVYDSGIGAFRQVEVSGHDASDGYLRRVFHTASYRGRAADNRHVIRLFGGITADSRDEAVTFRFHVPAEDRIFRLPLDLDIDDAVTATAVDLVYDPDELTITVRDIAQAPLEGALLAMSAGFEVGATGVGETVLTGGVGLNGRLDYPLDVSSTWFRLNADVGSVTGDRLDLDRPRVGHSATLVRDDPSSWSALVWGGDVRAQDTDEDSFTANVDNCPWIYNLDQLDSDGNGVGDVCDGVADPDGDGVAILDNCSELPNRDQADIDGDGIGDLCDPLSGGETGFGLLLQPSGAAPLERVTPTAPHHGEVHPETIFHAAATIQRDAALLYGGYGLFELGVSIPLGSGEDEAPRASIVSFDPSTSRASFQPLPRAEWPPVAFHAATPMDSPFDGSTTHRVLITGGAIGNPTASGERMLPYTSSACDDAATAAGCGLAMVATFSANPDGSFDVDVEDLSANAAGMRIPRWGHTTTRMPDGSYLVVGGLSSECEGDTLCVTPLWQGELYRPSALTPYPEAASGSFTCPEAPMGHGALQGGGGPDADVDTGPDGDEPDADQQDADPDTTPDADPDLPLDGDLGDADGLDSDADAG